MLTVHRFRIMEVKIYKQFLDSKLDDKVLQYYYIFSFNFFE